MTDDADASTAFLRQRRDLFVISAILLLIPIAEIEGTGNITMPFLGASMKIGKPEIITYTLWILWAYWYLRYFQAFNSLNKNHFKERYFSELSSLLYPKFYTLAESCKDSLIKQGELLIDDTNVNFSFKSQKYFCLSSEYECEFTSYSPHHEVKLKRVLKYKGFRYFLNHVVVLFKCCLKNIEITEYLLPFIFGIAPIIYFLFNL